MEVEEPAPSLPPYLSEVGRAGPAALGGTEGAADGELDGQAGHGARGEGLDPAHGLQQGRLALGALQGQLAAHGAGVVDDAHTGGVGAHVQRLNHTRHEHFDLLKLVWPHAA